MTRHEVHAPMAGAVVLVEVAPGAIVDAGTTLVVLESMKMQHPVVAPVRGRVHAVGVVVGDQVAEGQAIATVDEDAEAEVAPTAADAPVPEGGVRSDRKSTRLNSSH